MATELFETSATYQDLERFLGESGCAVCQCMAQSEQRYFDTLLYENAASPATEARLRASNGFCGRHLQTLLSWRDPLGTALMYGSILLERRRLIARWRKARTNVRLLRLDRGLTGIGRLCPACEAEGEAERRACEVLAAGLEAAAPLRKAWESSEGLCWPHYVQTRALCQRGRALLDGHEARRLDELGADVEALIQSFDYQWRGTRTPEVQSAWRRVVAAMAGRFQGGRAPRRREE